MLSIDAEAADRLLPSCRRCFPSRTDLRIRDLASVGAGWECDVFSFVLEGQEAGTARRENLILRVYAGSDVVQKSAREFAALRQLHRSGYPVPRALALEQEGSPLSRPFVIMERIEGPLLGELWPRTSPQRRRELLALFLNLFVDLHALDWRPFVADPSSHRPEESVGATLDSLLAYARRLRRSEFEPVLAWLKARLGEVPPGRLAVTHGDYHARNILVRPDGVPFVVDWTQSDVTDYRFDLGWTLLVIGAFDGPAARDGILAEYERLAGSPATAVEYFEVGACVRFLLPIVASLAEGPEVAGMRSEATAQMRGSLRQVAAVRSLLRDRTGLTIPSVEALLAGQA